MELAPAAFCFDLSIPAIKPPVKSIEASFNQTEPAKANAFVLNPASGAKSNKRNTFGDLSVDGMLSAHVRQLALPLVGLRASASSTKVKDDSNETD